MSLLQSYQLSGLEGLKAKESLPWGLLSLLILEVLHKCHMRKVIYSFVCMKVSVADIDGRYLGGKRREVNTYFVVLSRIRGPSLKPYT